MSQGVVRVELPKLGRLLEETRGRKEVWAWDGVVPARDVTLVAAFMKKGKTTLLTGLVNGLLKVGHYCGRTVGGGRKVLYLAPEEGDTLMRRFERLGFTEEDEAVLTVVPRGDPAWDEMVRQYRMREWPKVVAGLGEAGYDTVVLDGLHTLLQMFEPLAKEDNEGVGRFMTQFVLPFGSRMTVVAALHTKKAGGDPRIRVPPEEMIRGASAWMAHPGQILVMEHDRKSDTKLFHAFGRYEGSTAQGWMIRYDTGRRDYVGVGEGTEEEVAGAAAVVRETEDEIRLRMVVLKGLGEAGPDGIGLKGLLGRVTGRKTRVRAILEELEKEGLVDRLTQKVGRGRPGETWRMRVPEEPDMNGGNE